MNMRSTLGIRPAVMGNLIGVRDWRVRDVVNWHRLFGMMRGISGGVSQLGFYQLLYDVGTRLEFAYEPNELRGTIIPPEIADGGRGGMPKGEPCIALFVDAPEHMSGVATTVESWVVESERSGRMVRGMYTGRQPVLSRGIRFNPMGTIRLSAYEGLSMPVPQVHEVIDYMQYASFNIIHVSTPGPMGLLGLLCARMLGLPVCGTYHTDFPGYAVCLSGDESLREPAWRFMTWFYGQLDRVACPSASTRDALAARGFALDRLAVVGRGVDTSAFSPTLRDEALRETWGRSRPHKLLYVGRISEEKNLACLADAFRRLSEVRDDVGLVVVGDGPYREAMARALAGTPAVFTGALHGVELARAYASCDLFVFPSKTDTFGVVLIEAMASGLPALVSAEGGPKDCVIDGETGAIVNPMTPERLAAAIERMLENPAALAAMRTAARRHAATLTPERAFEQFWSFHAEQIETAHDSQAIVA
jgi:glycosyltransferase involved in cell wall biosynthesis